VAGTFSSHHAVLPWPAIGEAITTG